MKTKQEVINFLESKVGTKVVCVGNSSLDGQCVTLIKTLMEFLGVPNPYKARGHANSCITAYLNEGIADKGTGFLSVFSNKDMANGYGHIWCNAGDGEGVFYESNGQKPLIVTKGKTYSYDTVCNFDKYIKGETMPETKDWKGLDPNNLESLYAAVQTWADVRDGKYVSKTEFDKLWNDLQSLQKDYGILANKEKVCQTALEAVKVDKPSNPGSGSMLKIIELLAEIKKSGDVEVALDGLKISVKTENGVIEGNYRIK